MHIEAGWFVTIFPYVAIIAMIAALIGGMVQQAIREHAKNRLKPTTRVVEYRRTHDDYTLDDARRAVEECDTEPDK